ncbi:hypothetical protein ACA910_015921 [Epithemia clementina (nom. ined.)]
MKAKLSSLDSFTKHHDAADCVWVLKEIKAVMFRFEGQRFLFLSLDLSLTTLCTYKQGPDESLVDYLQHFRTNVEVFEHYGCGFGDDPGLLAYVKEKNPDLKDEKEILRISRDRALALAFLKRANMRRYEALLIDLEN